MNGLPIVTRDGRYLYGGNHVWLAIPPGNPYATREIACEFVDSDWEEEMKEDWQRIWERVRENKQRVEECLQHNFIREQPDKFGSDYICIHCQGKISSSEMWAYEIGYKHGVNAVATQLKGDKNA